MPAHVHVEGFDEDEGWWEAHLSTTTLASRHALDEYIRDMDCLGYEGPDTDHDYDYESDRAADAYEKYLHHLS